MAVPNDCINRLKSSRSGDFPKMHQGVGPYMSAAVASIAFGEPVAAVDGNVMRVMSRLYRIDACIDVPAGRRAIEQVADQSLETSRAGDWNQALMDVGSRICTPKSPTCGTCPMERFCQARAAGEVEALPVRQAKKKQRAESHHYAVIRRGREVLVRPRPADGLLAGTWMLPGGKDDVPLEDLIQQQTGLHVRLGEEQGPAKHVFSHRIWNMGVVDAEPMDESQELAPSCAWVNPDEPSVALSAACLRALAAAPSSQVQRTVP
jgi:A/G-specific adenine glycosylase